MNSFSFSFVEFYRSFCWVFSHFLLLLNWSRHLLVSSNRNKLFFTVMEGKQWTGCPEKLCGFHPWKYWKPRSIYTQLCGPLEASFLKRNKEYLQNIWMSLVVKVNIKDLCLSFTVETRTGCRNPIVASPRLSRGGRLPSPTYWQYFAYCSPGSFPIAARTHWQLMFKLVSLSAPSSIFQSFFPAVCSQQVLEPGLVPPLMQDLVLLVELHEAPVIPFNQPAEAPWQTSHSSQFLVMCKLAEGTLCLVLNEDVNRYKMLLMSIFSCSV